MGPRILDLQECLHHDGRTIWMEMREMPGQVIPVAFYAEHIPYLKFDAQDRVLMISVRAEYYGTTWRCWNIRPEKTDWMPEAPEAKKPAKKAGKK